MTRSPQTRSIHRPGALLLFGILSAACPNRTEPGKQRAAPAASRPSAPSAPRPEPATELGVNDIHPGTGPSARGGQIVKVNYTIDVLGGRRVESSYESGEPIEFTLGAGQVIAGWDQGTVGMKIGGKRRLVVPARLGYGSQPMPDAQHTVIPPDSTLICEIELLSVREPDPVRPDKPTTGKARRKTAAARAAASP